MDKTTRGSAEVFRSRESHQIEPKTKYSITIGLPTPIVYQFWRNFENLSRFMKDVRNVLVLSPTRSEWEIELRSGARVNWQADILVEIPNRLINWVSLPGSEVTVWGEVQFEEAPANLGSVVSLAMDYVLPGGLLVEWATNFSGEDPDTLTITNLKRLKALLETGEVPTIEGQASGLEHKSSQFTH